MAELEDDMRDAEIECQKIRNQIKGSESLLSEKRKLFSTTFGILDEEEKTPESPKETPRKAVRTPPAPKNVTRKSVRSNSMPRFMAPTVASRQRQSAAEREIVTRAKSFRPGTSSLVQFTGSQSLSFSDSRIKAFARYSNKKPRYEDSNGTLTESPRGVNNSVYSKSTSMPRSKIVTSSDPNLRVTLSRHRRTMSDFI